MPCRRAATNSHRAREAASAQWRSSSTTTSGRPGGDRRQRGHDRLVRAGSGPTPRRARAAAPGDPRAAAASGTSRASHDAPGGPVDAAARGARSAGVARTVRSTWTQGQKAGAPSPSLFLPQATAAPAADARATSSSPRRVLPMPGSPETSTMRPVAGRGVGQGGVESGQVGGPPDERWVDGRPAGARRSRRDRRRRLAVRRPVPRQRGGLGQDVGLEPAELGSRFDAELLHQHGPGLGVRPEGVALASVAVEGDHEQAPQPLPEAGSGRPGPLGSATAGPCSPSSRSAWMRSSVRDLAQLVPAGRPPVGRTSGTQKSARASPRHRASASSRATPGGERSAPDQEPPALGGQGLETGRRPARRGRPAAGSPEAG